MIVFAGPSLPPADRRGAACVTFRPPAGCGDIARAVAEGARVIGLIDGRFETCPSPWHKELLWALSRGVAVFGAASMGALRAVEMSPFGMIGVGQVFEAYRDGILEDDDEVALLHGPAEFGAVPLTEAMVNIRATLADAVAARVVDSVAAAAVAAQAKALFYKFRTWQALWQACTQARIATEPLAAWVSTHRRDVKREDARLLLSRLAAIPPATPPGFIETVFWRQMLQRHGIAPNPFV